MNSTPTKIHHYFIPRAANDYRPHLVRHHYVAFYMIALLALQAVLGIIFNSPPVPSTALSEAENATFLLVNEVRAGEGKPPLGRSSQLEEAARNRVKDMFELQYFAHRSPDGKNPWDFVTETGYIYSAVSENLARGFDRADEAVAAWQSSSEHSDKILSDKFTETGIAVASGLIDDKTTTIFVQIFATPSSSGGSPVVSITTNEHLSPHLSLANAALPAKIPFVFLGGIIVAFLGFDGVMIWRLGHLEHWRHKLTYFGAIALAVIFTAFLFTNIGGVL